MATDSCAIKGGGGADETTIREILSMKVIAVVGCSPKPERPSHFVSEYMRSKGYKIIPVNPAFTEILGEPCYPSLQAIPEPVDIVNIFRRSDEVFPIIQDAIKIKAKAVWMQDGVEHAAGAKLARGAGLKVVENNCLMREHSRQGMSFNKTVTTC